MYSYCMVLVLIATLLAYVHHVTCQEHKAVFLSRRAAAWYRALVSIIPGREKVLLEFFILVF